MEFDEIRRRLSAVERPLTGLGVSLRASLDSWDRLPAATCVHTGVVVEHILRDLWRRLGLKGPPERRQLEDLLTGTARKMEDEGTPLPRRIHDHVRALQLTRNRAAHHWEANRDDALDCLWRLSDIAGWYFTAFPVSPSAGAESAPVPADAAAPPPKPPPADRPDPSPPPASVPAPSAPLASAPPVPPQKGGGTPGRRLLSAPWTRDDWAAAIVFFGILGMAGSVLPLEAAGVFALRANLKEEWWTGLFGLYLWLSGGLPLGAGLVWTVRLASHGYGTVPRTAAAALVGFLGPGIMLLAPLALAGSEEVRGMAQAYLPCALRLALVTGAFLTLFGVIAGPALKWYDRWWHR